MTKLIAILLVCTLGLIAEENKNDNNKSEQSSEKKDDNSFSDAVSSLFEVRDPDKVDNKKSIDKLFSEKK